MDVLRTSTLTYVSFGWNVAKNGGDSRETGGDSRETGGDSRETFSGDSRETGLVVTADRMDVLRSENKTTKVDVRQC